MHDYLIRQEVPADYRETENLVREAFWNVYHPGCTEHYILRSFRGRTEFIPELDLVMVMDGRIIGQVMYVHSEICRDDGEKIRTVTFGPISIHPDYQRKGYGKILLDASLERAAQLGAGAVLITGNPAFYGKSGFVPGKEISIRYRDDPEAGYFLVRELRKGYLDRVSGTFADPAGYFAAVEHPEDFEAYDRTFPKKEKKVLPGQL